MLPLSEERFQWVRQRLAVLDSMVRELTVNQPRYYQKPGFAGAMPIVMNELLAEQLKLVIERNVLAEHLEKQQAEQNARDQAALNDGSR